LPETIVIDKKILPLILGVWWTTKDATFLQLSAFWSFKVIQGRYFWYQSKAHYATSY